MRAPPAPKLALAVVLTLACVSVAPPTASAADIPLDVYLHEVGARFHILPPDINAEVGDTLRLNVQNAGASPHDLLVCGEAPKPAVTCSRVLGQTGAIPPQGSVPLVITLEEPGEFEYYGTGFGEKEGQMVGYLHVTGEAKKDTPLPAALPLAALAIAAALVLGRRAP